MSLKPERNNSFTFLRLFFSVLVVISHAYPLGGFGHDPLARLYGQWRPVGIFALFGFFIVSGFLITQSAATQPMWRYALNRAARILPGLWVNLLLLALVLAPIVSAIQFPGKADFWDVLTTEPRSGLGYVWRNSLVYVRQYGIDSIFRGLPAGPVMNGSLWSLGPEVTCYFYLAALTLLGGLRHRAVAALIFAGFYALNATALFDPEAIRPVARWMAKGGVNPGHPLFRGVFLAFASGVLCYQIRAVLRWDWRWVFAAGAALAASFPLGVFDLVWPLAFPCVVLGLAFRLPFQKLEAWGDISYGFYIYSFPIQQCLALGGFQRHGLLAFAAMSVALSGVAGWLSWRCIERPALGWARAFAKRRTKAAPPPAAEVAV